jgi:hypothetical protein
MRNILCFHAQSELDLHATVDRGEERD